MYYTMYYAYLYKILFLKVAIHIIIYYNCQELNLLKKKQYFTDFLLPSRNSSKN